MRKVVLSGMRPTGKLHLGHWVGALKNWVSLQDEYQCFFMVADWHALMSEYKNTSQVYSSIVDNVIDWLICGVDPKKACVFIQSEVSEHLALYMYLSFLTPLGRLFRCPTFKEQMKQLQDKEINTLAFLGYPVLQSADILLYKAGYVPVGDDQLPHLEICRELARKFNFTYDKDLFPEPQALLTPASRLLGLDGRKMSKSYNNYISLDEKKDVLNKKVLAMFTDPERKFKSDPGHPQMCNVYQYYSIFCPEVKNEVYDYCSNAKKGCRECKQELARILDGFISPLREKKEELQKDIKVVYGILEEGRKKAKNVALDTISQVKGLISAVKAL